MAEFVSVVVAAALGFLGLFASAIAAVVFWLLAMVSGVFLICALFSLAVWALLGDPAAAHATLVCLLWGAVPFILLTLLRHYSEKATAPRQPRKPPDGRYELAAPKKPSRIATARR